MALAVAEACSELDPSNQTYCDLNPTAEDCRASVTAVDGWWCEDLQPPALRPPKPITEPVGFILPVVEWGSLAPMAGRGLTAKLCSAADFSCANPLAPVWEVTDGPFGGMTLPPGAAGIPVAEGFDGFIKLEVRSDPTTPEPQRFVAESYYLAGKPISGDVTQGPPILMVQNGARDTILTQSFRGVDLTIGQTRGAVVANVFDCDGAPVENARIEVNVTGLIPFQLPASRIPIQQPPPYDAPIYTGPSGSVGYLNAPDGAIQVRAFRGNETQEIGSVELGVVAGEISVGSIRPRYLNDANVAGVPIDPMGQRTP